MNAVINIQKRCCLLLLGLLITVFSLQAAPFKALPLKLPLPNGDTLQLYATGDEYYNWLHDQNGYTVVQATDGYYYYAQKSGDDLIPSSRKVGEVSPDSLPITRWLKKKREISSFPNNQRTASPDKPVYAPRQGTLNNLIIYISFNDQAEFTTPRTVYDNQFNNPAGPSLLHYYQEVSYGNLHIVSHHFPICAVSSNLSYKDSKNSTYFMTTDGGNTNGYNSNDEFERMNREHQLLQRAINAIKPQIEANFSANDLDADGDGNIDNVWFIIKGNCQGWNSLLWAHRWTLYSTDVRIHGKRVYDYVFQPENQVQVRTSCHEMFHSLGAPDLYHYSYDNFTPVGIWDLMENSDAHMGAYMKWKYAGQKWIHDIPEITCSGTYTLHPLTCDSNNCYRIPLPGPGSNEFLVVEYRRTTGMYESTLPGSGLLIYRINPTVTEGNRNGPPDEVYIYRPGGSLSNDGDIYKAHYSANTGRTQFDITTTPNPFKSNGSVVPISITDITEADSTISFTVGGLTCRPAIPDSLSPISYNGSSDTVCQGSTVYMRAELKDAIGPFSYNWEPIPAGSFIINQAQSANPYILTTDLAAGTYWMALTITDHGEIPEKTVYDTVSFSLWERPQFTIRPQEADYCVVEKEYSLENIKVAYDIYCNPWCFHDGPPAHTLESCRVCGGDLWIEDEIKKIILQDPNTRQNRYLGTDITLSTENGVLGGKPPYYYNWYRCGSTSYMTIGQLPFYQLCKNPFFHQFKEWLCVEKIWRNDSMGMWIPQISMVDPCDNCFEGNVHLITEWSIPYSAPEVTVPLLAGCNCFSLTVSDAHGCSSTQTINPVGHYFENPTISVRNSPLECGKAVLLYADAFCPGSECTDCYKQCHAITPPEVIWGPSEIVTGSGQNAVTIPLWQKEKIYAIFVDPVTGCRDTVYKTLNITCSNPSVPVISLADASFCDTELPATITAKTKGIIGPCTYHWRGDWGLNETTNSPSMTLPAGLINCHTVKVTVTDNGYTPAKSATATAEICISLMPPPFTLSSNRSEVCVGDTVTLTVSNYGMGLYQWKVTGGAVSDHWNGTATGTILSSSSTFTLEATGNGADGQRCKQTGSITVKGHKVNATISPLSGFECNRMMGDLKVTASCSQGDNIVSYSWGPTGAYTGTTNTATVSTQLVTNSTTFYADVTDGFGCKGHAELTVGGGGICEVIVTGDTLCKYNATSNPDYYAYPSVIVIGGTPSIHWTSTAISSSYISNAYSPEAKVNTRYLAPGTYPIDVEISDGVTSQTYRTNIVILDIPTVTVTTPATEVCIGEDILLSSTVTPAGNYKYYWLNGASGPESGTTATAVMGSPGTVNYTLKVENEFGCKGTDNIRVTGLSKVFLCAHSRCTGSSTYEASLDVLNGTTPYDIYYDAGLTQRDTSARWSAAHDMVTIPRLNSGQAYTFYIGGPQLCKTESVDVFQECNCYAGAFLTTDSVHCDSPADSVNIYINVWGSSLYSFDLQAPDGSVVLSVRRSSGKSWTYTAFRPHEGTYTLIHFKGYTKEEDLTGCDGQVYQPAHVVFPNQPHFSINANTEEVCSGDTILLSATGLTTDINCRWSTSQGGHLLTPERPSTQAIIADGTNTFTATAQSPTGCVSTHSIDITGHRVTAGPIISDPTHHFACNTSGTLTLSTSDCSQSDCPLSYQWSPASALQNTSGVQVTTRPLQETVTFAVKVTDRLGCSDSANIIINTGICEVKVSGDTLCAYLLPSTDSLAQPTVQIKGGTPNVTWRNKSSANLSFSDSTSISPTINTSQVPSGIYPIEVEINDGFTVTTHSTSIIILANPQVTLQADKTTACIGEAIRLTTQIQPVSAYTYYWLHGSTGSENSPTASAIVSKTGLQDYIVKIEDTYGCSAYDTITVKGLKEAFLCASTTCINEETFQTQIKVLGGTPPYTLYQDAAHTQPINIPWNGQSVTLNSLVSGQTYTYYLAGNNLCYPTEISVTKDCECKTAEAICEAGLYIETAETDCILFPDSTFIRIQAWGAEKFSFRLLRPDGLPVLTVTNDTCHEWIYTTGREGEGIYQIAGFEGFTENIGTCPGQIFGKAIVFFPETSEIEAGPDQYICRGDQITLSATGNTCGFFWNKGVVNGIPFTPQNTQTYTAEGHTLNGCPATDSVTVYVGDPVNIIHQSADVSIEKGQNAAFTVQTVSSSPVTYIWQHQKEDTWITLNDNGHTPKINGSLSSHLKVQNISRSWNNTRLRCIACNKCGCDTAYFKISVTGCIEEGSVTLHMEEGITPDKIPGNLIDGWYCRGVRIGVRAVVTGVEIPKDAVYNWTVDGLPVDYSHSDYISWIPEMWEDDIVLKVCIQSDEFCTPLCAKYIRLKSKLFEKPALQIATSIDPRRTVCPGETVYMWAVTQNMGTHPDYHWYSDIFHLGTANTQTFTVKDQDVWIKLTGKVSDEICTDTRLLNDTVFLRQGEKVIPELQIIPYPADSLVCRYEEVEFRALYAHAGKSPQIFWEADIWNRGSGTSQKIPVNDKDTWIHCYLLPSPDVCSTKDTVHAYKKMSIIPDNPQITITSDLEDKEAGELLTFYCHPEYPVRHAQYHWEVNELKVRNSDSVFTSAALQEGDKVQCILSGEKSCQQEMASNIIQIHYSHKRDTSVLIYKNETLKGFSLYKTGDKNLLFELNEQAENGKAILTTDGKFRYTPKQDFIGGDKVTYRLREPRTKNIVAQGSIYITVADQEKYFIPNIITPNGDGINDTWVIHFLKDYPHHTLTLYNRNGVTVYRSRNYQNDFDGTGEGTGYVSHLHLPNGIYTYVIDLGNKVILKSWLEIRRDLKYFK